MYDNYDKTLTRICENTKEYIEYYKKNNLSFESQEKIVSLRLKELAIAKAAVETMKKNNYSPELIDTCSAIIVSIDELVADFRESNIELSKINTICNLS
jgi:hypothetical protein